VTRTEDYIPFAIPMEAATNKAEVEEFKKINLEAEKSGQKLTKVLLTVSTNQSCIVNFFKLLNDLQSETVRPKVPFSLCLEHFAAEELVEDFYSVAAQAKTTAHKTIRLKTFPSYLIIQVLDKALLFY